MANIFEYVSFLDDPAHVNRHFGGSTTIGSKFFTQDDNEAVRDLVASLDGIVHNALAAQELKDGVLSREVIELTTSEPVGTDAMINLAGHDHVEMLRDAGTEHQTIIRAVLAGDIPATAQVTIIAGPYGTTDKAGLYTVFPGDPGRPFPDPETQEPEDLSANRAFWEEHGFLARKDEIVAAITDMKRLAAGALDQESVKRHNAVTGEELEEMIYKAEALLGFRVQQPEEPEPNAMLLHEVHPDMGI